MINFPDPARDALWEEFDQLMAGATRIFELGTRRWVADEPTIHSWRFPHVADYLGVDLAPGTDVHVVADAERLAEALPERSFDGCVCVCVMEHVARPWRAIEQIAKLLRPGGALILDTHQSFVIHHYPKDYWRFTIEALAVLCEDAGLEIVKSGYYYRCRILPDENSLDWAEPRPDSFLSVGCVARRPYGS